MIRYEMPMEVVAGCPVCAPDREATPMRNRLLCSTVSGAGASPVSATEGDAALLSYDPAWAKLGNDWEMREADFRIQAELAGWLPPRIFDVSALLVVCSTVCHMSACSLSVSHMFDGVNLMLVPGTSAPVELRLLESARGAHLWVPRPRWYTVCLQEESRSSFRAA